MSKLDTNLSVRQIELLLHDSGIWNKRQDIMIPNLSWGLLNHEADFVAITKSGYLTEVEIKRSFADLKADFKKDVFHRDERVYHFMYCLPISIKDKALHLFHENYGKIAKLYGHNEDYKYANEFFPFVLWYDENGNLTKEPQKLSSRSGARLGFSKQDNRITDCLEDIMSNAEKRALENTQQISLYLTNTKSRDTLLYVGISKQKKTWNLAGKTYQS